MWPLPTQIAQNLAWIQGQPWAFYRLTPYSYDALSPANQEAQVRQAAHLYRLLQDPNLHVGLYLIKQRFNWPQYLSDLAASAPAATHEAAQRSTNFWRPVTAPGGQIQPDYAWILAVELPRKRDQHTWWQHTFAKPLRHVEQLLGLDPEPGPGAVASALGQEHHLHQHLTTLIRCEPLAADAVADFYRHHFFRGLALPPLPAQLLRLWPRGRQDYAWLAAGLIKEHTRAIESEQEGQGTRWMTFVSVAALPQEISIPGHELFYHLQQANLGDVLLRYRHVAPREALKAARKKKADISDASSHIEEVADVPWEILEQQEEAKALELHMSHARPPLLDGHIVIALDAPNEESLHDEWERTRDLLDGLGLVPARPMGDQGALFRSWLPSSHWTGLGYRLPLLPESAAVLSVPGAADLLGDPQGMPIGHTRRGAAVKVDVARGPQINRSASLAITGGLGSGKTFLANLLVYYAVAIWGARALVVDPKGERRHWPASLPGLTELVRRIDLDGRKNPGALDPYRLVRDREAATQGVLSLLGDLLQIRDRQDELAILEASQQMTEPSMPALLSALASIAPDMAAYLRHVAQLPLGQLFLGEGPDVPLMGEGLIILELVGLRLPDRGQSATTLTEKASVTAMSATALLAEQFILGDGSGFRVALLDEAWTWLRSREGRALADRLERAGRSANAGMWLVTQNPSDIGPDLLNNLGSYFCLGTGNDEESRIAAEALHLDFTADLQTQLQQARSSGQGFYRDLAGRGGWLQIVCPDPALAAVFDTKPEAVPASLIESVGGR